MRQHCVSGLPHNTLYFDISSTFKHNDKLLIDVMMFLYILHRHVSNEILPHTDTPSFADPPGQSVLLLIATRW